MTDNQMPLDIRPATGKDVPLILSFIRKLAEYGDISDEVSATEDDIRAALFGPHRSPRQSCLRRQRAGGLCLVLLQFLQLSRPPGMFVEDLYVENAHRSKGVGKALLVHLARLGPAAFLRQARMGRPQLE